MPDWPLAQGDGQYYEGMPSASIGTAVTAGSANTKGSWAEMFSATSFDASAIHIAIITEDTTARYLLDVGVGANGSEQVLIPNLNHANTTTYGGFQVLLPVRIPKGTRVTMRCQSNNSGAILSVNCMLVSSGFAGDPGFSRVVAYGADTSDSGGTQVDPGGTANTKGAYSQLTASTTAPMRSMLVTINHQAAAITTSMVWFVDIAVGAASSETVVIPSLAVRGNGNSEAFAKTAWGPFPVMIPIGTRISARAQATQTTTRTIDVAVYGID